MENWYVKNTQGKVFGPIDFETLKGWVRDGRVEPLAGVSPDLKRWMLAPMKPELEMDWVVENNPGQFYGPTHRAVIEDLKKSGALSKDSRFYKDDRGRVNDRVRELEHKLAQREAAALSKDAALAEAQKSLAIKEGNLTEVRNALAQRDARLAAGTTALAQKETQLTTLAKTLAQKESELSARAGDAARYEAALRQKDLQMTRLSARIEELESALARKAEVHPREWKADAVLVPEVVSAEPPPPVARQAFTSGHATPSSLAELERQAQQELARMGAGAAKKFFNLKR